MTHTEEERKLLNRWRGLKDSVLEELNRIDRIRLGQAEGAFTILSAAIRGKAEAQRLIAERERVVAIRRRLGVVDPMTRLPRIEA